MTVSRAAIASLVINLAACGGGGGFQRPDYAAEARARCDEAESTSDPARALALYGMAIDADPRLARAHHGKARILERSGRDLEAERSYDRAVEVAADDIRSQYLFERARFLKQRGRIESAVRDLNWAIKLLASWPEKPLTVETRLMRAQCRILLRAWPGAREDLEAAAAAGPDADQAERAKAMRLRVEAALAEERR